MSLWRPSVAEERWLAIAARLAGNLPQAYLAQRTGGWRRTGPLARLAFALLGLVAAGCTAGLLGDHSNGLVSTGIVLVVAAESLILRARLFACGIEEALEMVGLVCIGAGTLGLLQVGLGDVWLLLGVAVCAVAGLRLLNPLLTTLAVVALGGWISTQPSAIAFDSRHGAYLTVNLFLLGVALAALASLAASIRRPSYERMLSWLVAVLPAAGLIWLAGVDLLIHLERAAASSTAANLVLVATVSATAAAMLVVGLRRRSHAALISFLGCCAHLAWQLRALSGLSLQARLLLWGSVLLLAALVANRYLRRPRAGVTSEPMTDRSGALDLLQMASTSALTQQATPQAASAQWTPTGGRFGGGGASGSY